MGKKRILLYILIIIALVPILFFLIRLVLPKQIDDVSPEIPCSQELLEKADVFYVIPKFNNKSIAENETFCEKIKAMNKTLRLHGVYHYYNEFSTDRNKEYLQEGINIFEECFNETPKAFKPPQLAISKNNKKLMKSKMKLNVYLNQWLHKVYHCENNVSYGIMPNWVIELF